MLRGSFLKQIERNARPFLPVRPSTRWLAAAAHDNLLEGNRRRRKQRSSKENTKEESAAKSEVKRVFDEIDKIMDVQKKKLPEIPKLRTPFAPASGKNKLKAIAEESEQEPAISPLAGLSSSDKSLFDVFKIPKVPSSAPKSAAFDEQAHQQFLGILEIVEKDPKFRRKHTRKHIKDEVAAPVMLWLKTAEPVVLYELPLLDEALEQGLIESSSDSEQRGAFAEQLTTQRDHFKQYMDFTDEQIKFAAGVLRQVASQCAKRACGPPSDVIWHKIKEAGIAHRGLLHALMYVSATFSSGNRQKRVRYGKLTGASILNVLETDRPAEDDGVEDGDLVDQADEIAAFHDLLYEPTVQSIQIRVRLLVTQGKAREAEKLLNEPAVKADLRLRAYVPVLRLYLEQKEINAALTLYKRMREMPSVHMEADTYVSLLAGIAENGFFQVSAPPIEVAKDLGYSASSGPLLFDEIATEMASDVIEITMGSTKRLFNAFARGFPDSNLDDTSSLSPLKMTKKAAREDELIVNRVFVDPSSGVCSRSGAKLRLINLEEDEREKLKEAIIALAGSEQLKLEEKTNIPAQGRAEVELMQFYQWLDEREGEPFTAFVDGANVGYHMQNFETGRFSFHQLQFCVDSLEKQGERPLVILPLKYLSNSFAIAIGVGGSGGIRKQTLNKEEAAIRDRLTGSHKVIAVPRGLLDDYYWILASISKQTNSRKGRDLHVPADDPQGRWPGARPILITNDQMRDHKIEMLEPRLFRRWYSNFIVNYNFAAFIKEKASHPQIGFSAADFFSREIQCNRTKGGSLAWHFPISETDDEWFCIRIPTGERPK